MQKIKIPTITVRNDKQIKYMKLPFGYDISAGELVIDEYEANAVRLIFDMHQKEYDAKEIRRVLKDKNYHTRYDEFKPISTATIQKVINNMPFYQGYFKFGGEWVRGTHPRILAIEHIKVPYNVIY